jgi:hypothetical protein
MLVVAGEVASRVGAVEVAKESTRLFLKEREKDPGFKDALLCRATCTQVKHPIG